MCFSMVFRLCVYNNCFVVKVCTSECMCKFELQWRSVRGNKRVPRQTSDRSWWTIQCVHEEPPIINVLPETFRPIYHPHWYTTAAHSRPQFSLMPFNVLHYQSGSTSFVINPIAVIQYLKFPIHSLILVT